MTERKYIKLVENKGSAEVLFEKDGGLVFRSGNKYFTMFPDEVTSLYYLLMTENGT